MNRLTKDIMVLLNIDVKLALQVQSEVEMSGIDLSECTKTQLNNAIRQAYYDILAGDAWTCLNQKEIV